MDTHFPNRDVSEYAKGGMQPFLERRPRKPSVVHWRTESMPTSTSASNSNSTSLDLDSLPRLSKHTRSSSSSHTEAPPAYDDSNSYSNSNRKRNPKEKEIERGFRDNEKGPYAYVHAVPPTPLPELLQEEVYRIVGIANNGNNVSSSSVNSWVNQLIGKKEETPRHQVELEPVLEQEHEIPVGERCRISKPYPLGYRPKTLKSKLPLEKEMEREKSAVQGPR